MDIESAPNDLLTDQPPQIRLGWSETIHYATAWWMPPPESQNPEAQARAFVEVRMVRCVNEWSIE